MSANNQLATVTQSIVPPPKKKDVIEATATALFEDLQTKLPLMKAELEKQKAQIETLVKRAFNKHRSKFKPSYRFAFGEHAAVSFNAEEGAFPEIEALHEKVRTLERDLAKAHGKTRWDFVQELRAAATGKSSNPTVSTMLADPKIKSGLLKAGLALLAKPTAEDKANAIAA